MTWGGIHGAGRALWTDIASRCAAHVADKARARAVGVLRQGLGVTLARAVATQLEQLLEVGPASVVGGGRRAVGVRGGRRGQRDDLGRHPVPRLRTYRVTEHT